MTSKLWKLTCIAFTAISFLVVSCSKEGPAGAVGPTGTVGPVGATGQTGATGVTNVIYSDWLDVKFKPSPDSSVWSAKIIAPQLVDSILNKGEIKVYWNIGSDSTNGQFVVNLPVLDVLLFNINITANPYFSFQNIDLLANINLSSAKLRGYNYSQFRYIIIPGTSKAGRYSSVDWKDYNKVKEYLGLKD